MNCLIILIVHTILIISPTSCNENSGTRDNEQRTNISQILYGDEAGKYQFPHHVSLQKKMSDKYRHICSGAILKSRWIVTTAYCVVEVKSFLRIVAGSLIYNQTDVNAQIISVVAVKIHPNYQGGISENDIALLKLKKKLEFSKAVMPIRLPPRNTEDLKGAALISGWNVYGHDFGRRSFKNLFYIIVYVAPHPYCARNLKYMNMSLDKVLCTERVTDEPYCPGESGGGLIFGGYLLGLTSWGTLPCDLTVYTRISYFIDFILEYIE